MTGHAFVADCIRYPYSGASTKTLSGTDAAPVASAVPIGDTIGLLVNCPAAGGINTGITVTDTKSNVWVNRGIVAQATTPSNGQLALVTCDVTHALTTSDKLTLTTTSNEIQTVTEGGTGLTSFTLTYSGQTTTSIAAAASAATVQAALIALSNIGPSDVVVTGANGGPYTVTFQGTLANTNVSQMTSTPTGGTGTVTVATTTAGGGIGAAIWSVLGMQFTALDSYDTATGVGTNQGSTSQNLNSGTTAVASQSAQLVFGGFAGTGAGQALNTLVPAGFTARPVLATTGTVRDLWGVYGFVNTPGTRNITAHMGDNASHAWCGLVAAYNITLDDTGIYRLDSGGVLTNIAINPL